MDSSKTGIVSDDAELAKVLESMNAGSSAPATPTLDPVAAPATEAPQTPVISHHDPTVPVVPSIQPVVPEPTPLEAPTIPTPEPVAAPSFSAPVVSPVSAAPAGELDSIKQSALSELRPLVDKLDLPADEKFDTLLLLLRSTDDKTLVPKAHEAAKSITDEAKRAQALLDVIKEIDYFSSQK